MEEKGTIHYAKYQHSIRLQRFLAFMLDGKPHTTMSIIFAADICAVNSAKCELALNGFKIECIKKGRPAVYQLFDIEQAQALSDQLLANREGMA